MILLVITCLAILRSPSLSPFPVHHSQHPVEALTPHLHICGTLPVIYERTCDERLHSQQPTIGWMARPSLFQHPKVPNNSTHALLAGTCNCTGRFGSETQLAYLLIVFISTHSGELYFLWAQSRAVHCLAKDLKGRQVQLSSRFNLVQELFTTVKLLVAADRQAAFTYKKHRTMCSIHVVVIRPTTAAFVL